MASLTWGAFKRFIWVKLSYLVIHDGVNMDGHRVAGENLLGRHIKGDSPHVNLVKNVVKSRRSSWHSSLPYCNCPRTAGRRRYQDLGLLLREDDLVWRSPLFHTPWQPWLWRGGWGGRWPGRGGGRGQWSGWRTDRASQTSIVSLKTGWYSIFFTDFCLFV